MTDEFFRQQDDDDTGAIEQGTIGWGEEAQWYDLGTDENDGLMLVNVTLVRGKNPVAKVDGTRAQGNQIRCRMSASAGYEIPRKGAQCIVAIPAGMRGIPGAGVILAVIYKNPTIQLQEERVVLDYGPDRHVVIKAKSVTLSDHGAPARLVMVGTPMGSSDPAVMALDETGTGFNITKGGLGLFAAHAGDAKGLVQMNKDGLEIMHKKGGLLRLRDDQVFVNANKEALLIGAQVRLGSSAAITMPPGTGATYGPAGIVAVSSTTVYISP